jgi:hypothetical protein
MTSARALWTAQLGRSPCWPADATSRCPAIAGRAVVIVQNTQYEHAKWSNQSFTELAPNVTRVSECPVSPVHVRAEPGLCCR